MITNSYRKSEPKMTPKNFVEKIDQIDYCLIIFSPYSLTGSERK